MPSDPSGHFPHGVLTRPAPDFFDDNLAVGGALIAGALATDENYFSIALFNNAFLGSVFKVYAITGWSNFAGGVALFFVKGVFGVLLNPCKPIRPDRGTPFGQIYTQQSIETASGVSPYLVGVTPFAHIGTAGESQTTVSPFPLLTVPGGYSLVAANVDACSGSGASKTCGGAFFWYQIANE